MRRTNQLILLPIAMLFASILCACNFFQSPVDDVVLPKYSPYLTVISFLEANADTTYILISESQVEGKGLIAFDNSSAFQRLWCVQGAEVTLTDLTTGHSAKAFNDYNPTANTYIGLYMVTGNQLPIIAGHEYELHASYRDLQPVTARCTIPTFSKATFNYSILSNGVSVTVNGIDSTERHFFVYIKPQNGNLLKKLITTTNPSNGSIATSFVNEDNHSYYEPPAIITPIDTCLVYEIDQYALRYFEKIELYYSSDYGLLSKPVYLYSNINGGQGIFAARREVPQKR